MGVLGMFVVLGGSLLYTIVKMREGKKAVPISVVAKPAPKVDAELRKD
jgi:hypothetical protein